MPRLFFAVVAAFRNFGEAAGYTLESKSVARLKIARYDMVPVDTSASQLLEEMCIAPRTVRNLTSTMPSSAKLFLPRRENMYIKLKNSS
jgi:hypothetical protein